MATDSPHADAPPDPVSRRQAPGLRERLSVAGRIGVAALGGYGVAALATALGALVLPLPRAEAVSAATQASFAVMAAAVVFTFAARSLARAALGIAGAAAILSLGLWLAGGFASGAPA